MKQVIELPAEVVTRLIEAVDNLQAPRTEAVRLLTVRQTAKYLGRTEDWCRRQLPTNIPAIRDGEIRYDIRDLDAYIEKNKPGSRW